MVSVGQKAPDFLAPAYADGGGEMLELFTEVDAHEAVILLFAPADFVPTTTAEWRAVAEAGWHTEDRLAVFGLTGDSLFSHAAYADQYDIPFPIISDFHSGIADQYDLLAAEWEGHRQIPQRAAVVIDADWELRARETDVVLAETIPAPAQRASETLTELGIDVTRPEVEYETVQG